ncbi:MAG: MATE family efflux transporter [Clostridia bacterium]|nr:MATE family efflux transporter [Clostridia bacterium]MBQ7048763.1 MATE family efflux transporter [Clostridia bacterium]
MTETKSRIQLSDHFTYKRLLRFVFPSVAMMVFTSVYGVVDGLFVSNVVGKTPFAAINLIWPFIMMLCGTGFMMGTGGTAIVSKTLGEGKKELANKYFTMLTVATVVLGIVLSAVGICLVRPVSVALGAEGQMLESAVLYGIILLIALPFFMLQTLFQSFFVAAEKPKLGLWITVGAGLTNIVLDAVLVFPFGLVGAALATVFSQVVGGVIPLLYFFRKNGSLLRFTKTKFYGKVLLRTCTNGMSELMGNISASLIGTLFNIQLMSLEGENGVSAYGVIMYVSFLFASIFFGYSVGSAPVIGYNYGAENKEELKSLFKKSLRLMILGGAVMAAASISASRPLSEIFVGYDRKLCDMTAHGFVLYAFHFLLCGVNIFASSMFTALNNGMVSAIISFLRTFGFQVVLVLTLPMVWGIDGIWLSVTIAEVLALLVSIFFILKNKNKYGYM